MKCAHSEMTMSSDTGFDTGLRPEAYERPTPFETPWGSFAVFRIDVSDGAPEFVAVQSFCPHLDGPLFQGTRAGDDDEIVCPWHRWRFALRTGKLLEAELAPPEPALDQNVDLAVCDVRVGPKGTLVLERRAP